jgi:hypothetical protein
LILCFLGFPEGFDAVPKEGRPPTQQEVQLFLPYRGFCARKGVSNFHKHVSRKGHCKLHDLDIFVFGAAPITIAAFA